MRQILEDAAVLYRQELESLQLIVAPAIVLGPVLVIVAAMGLPLALGTVPFFLLVYLFTYAACARAASEVLHNNDPQPLETYLSVFEKAPALIRLAGPVGLLFAGMFGSALVVSDLDFPFVAVLFGVVAVAIGVAWAAKHAYDAPFVMAHGLSADEVMRIDDSFSKEEQVGAIALLGLVGLPLVPIVLLSWGLGAALVPVVGAGIFVIGLALWLPFAALGMTQACARLVEETASRREQPQAQATRYAGTR